MTAGSRSRLEERYRRVLRVLPRPYRLAWEEEMVATFLATMDSDDPDQASYLADFGRPSWAEVASVVALAVRLRVGAGGAVPRYPAWGAALVDHALTRSVPNPATAVVLGATEAGAVLAVLIPLWRRARPTSHRLAAARAGGGQW